MNNIKKIDHTINILDAVISKHIEITHVIIKNLYLHKKELNPSFFIKYENQINEQLQPIINFEESYAQKVREVKIISDLIFKLLKEENDTIRNEKKLHYFENLQKKLLAIISDVKITLIEVKNQHDHLTELPLRKLLFKDIDKLLKKKRQFYICFLDLDSFKKINDQFGYDVGDKILSEFSRIIRGNEFIKLYRYGGEEFIGVIQYFEDRDIKELINNLHLQIKEKLKAPEVIDRDYITFSSGTILFDQSKNIQANIENSSEIMKKSKQFGKNQSSFGLI